VEGDGAAAAGEEGAVLSLRAERSPGGKDEHFRTERIILFRQKRRETDLRTRTKVEG